MPAFQARVEEIKILDDGIWEPDRPIVVVSLKKGDGTDVAILHRRATTQHVAFARSLRKGATYSFPQAWIEFEKASERK